MRITFLSHFPGRGGSSSLLLQLKRHFEAAGHQTTTLVGTDSANPQLEEYAVFKPNPLADWRTRMQAYRSEVMNTRPDLVYVVSGMEEGDLLRFLEVPRVQHIFTIERHEFLDSFYYIEQHAPFWEACTVNTPDILDFARPSGPFTFAELEAPYDIDLPFHEVLTGTVAPSLPLQVCMITRLERFQKRVQWLPEIVSLCQKAGLDLRWHIYGEGPAESVIRDGLERLGCSSLVDFHGWVSGSELARRAAQHDLFFSCSRFEGLPVAMVEAMFCGLACVVPDLAGGIHHVIQSGGAFPYVCQRPADGARALCSAAADLSIIGLKKREAKAAAHLLFGQEVVTRKLWILETGLRGLVHNGRTERIESARRFRKTKAFTFLKRKLLGVRRD